MAKDLYQELGVAKTADADSIRRAYRKLAKDLHPDKNLGDKSTEDRFKKINAAFDILGDSEKREKYDRGEIDADGHARGFGGGSSNGGAPFGGFNGRFEGADFDDILGQVFGGQGGPFGGQGSPFGGGGRSPARGFDVRARLEIDLEEAIQGAKKRIAFSDGRTIEVTIPPGAHNEQVLRLKGQGAQGRGGAGDALIELVLRPHPVFQAEGADLKMDLPVSVPDAVLGAKIQAPTPDGPVTLTVPKGSNSGRLLRLKGRGGVDPTTGKRGDLTAELVLVLPDAPGPELEAFAEQWRRERPYAPRRKP